MCILLNYYYKYADYQKSICQIKSVRGDRES